MFLALFTLPSRHLKALGFGGMPEMTNARRMNAFNGRFHRLFGKSLRNLKRVC